MSEFNLLKKLSEKREEPLLPKNIKYQEYDVVVECIQYKVYIPLSETGHFEQNITESIETLYSFNKLLRVVRGIKSKGSE